MNEELKDTPEPVAILAERCFHHVKSRFELELDFKSETLSVLDYFIQDLLNEEGDGSPLSPDDERRAPMIHLLAPTIGAYFGEVLYRVFPCRWRLFTEEPEDWLLEFEHVPLRFNPIGAAAEALAGQNVDTWNGAIATAPEEAEALSERLAAAPPIPEDQFFMLTTRFEVLQIAESWLSLRQMKDNQSEPLFFSRDDYDRIFATYEV